MVVKSKKYKVVQPKKNHVPPKSQRKPKTNGHDSFLEKITHFEDYVDSFSLQELLWYFQVVAESKGYKYVITSYDKEMHFMKQAKKNYSNAEICGMIEFLYLSNQTYLRKDNLTPSILVSRWVNTIYADMKLWAKDEFDKPKNVSKKEWKSDKKGVSIGVKL